ncbi:MAG: RHS repeat domain-containing protein, partial [Gammaproteobacteria bacterium]
KGRCMHFLIACLLTLLALPAGAVERVIHYHNDALGSAIAATDQDGRVVWRKSYAPYGQSIGPAASNEPGYTGKFQEPDLGIQNFGARWYDPRIGRFLAIDPAGFDAANPQSFNRYAYANNNPYKYVDPDGNSPLDVGFFIADTVSFGLALYSGDPEAIASAGVDLAASAVGLASPVPGVGLAIKAARAADTVGDAVRLEKEAVVIGENMKRVEKYAAKIGADSFKSEGMNANRVWIQQAKGNGKQVIDIGPHFERRADRIHRGSRPDSPFYNMERSETRGYEGYEKVFERTGKNSGGAPGVD